MASDNSAVLVLSIQHLPVLFVSKVTDSLHEAGELTYQPKPTGIHLGEPACNNSRSSDTQVSS